MIQGDQHIHRTGLDGNVNAHTLEPIIGLNNVFNSVFEYLGIRLEPETLAVVKLLKRHR